MDIIVGTAGHIDHGKTALVKALTGTDADRLPEEKQRGITIDLGFAELELGDVRIGFVDVPGHERFVKNMLAGASGIDLVALVVAADEGVMPQTREHFEICRLLGTGHGIVVLTKTDLVSEEFLELVRLDVAELVEGSFLEDAPVTAVSARTGEGIGELKEILAEAARRVPARRNETVTRLPVDRAFSVKGFGAVVTGTLASGRIGTGAEMELLPSGRRVRVRGVQTHGRDVGEARAGQRTAVNLGGIDHSEIHRGEVLTEPGALRPTQIFDASVEVLEDARRPLRSRQRVRVHLGTVEALARLEVLNRERAVEPGAKDLVQVRLEAPVAAVPGERFILRQYSPQVTIAGGRILDALASKHKRRDLAEVRSFLEELGSSASEDRPGRVALLLAAAGAGGLGPDDLRARTGWRGELLGEALETNVARGEIVRAEGVFVARTPFERLKESVMEEIEEHHRREPLSPGVLRETLRERTAARVPPEIFRAALASLEEEELIDGRKDLVRASSHSLELSPEEERVRERLLETYHSAGLQVPTLESALSEASAGTKVSAADARRIFEMLVTSSEVVRVTEEFYFTRAALGELVRRLKEFADEGSGDRLIGVPEFKNIAGISRKYAIPLLEYLDRERITRRAGDKRLVL